MTEADEDQEYAEALAAYRVALDRHTTAKKPITERERLRQILMLAQHKAVQAAREHAEYARYDQMKAIIRKADAGADIDDIATQFGMTVRRVRQIVKGYRWVLTADFTNP
jgi:hypothetical protein